LETPVTRCACVPVGGTALRGEHIPVAAPEHPLLARASRSRGVTWRALRVVVLVIPVQAPLAHVAVHIVQAEAILLRVVARLACPKNSFPLRGATVGEIGVEVGLPEGELVAEVKNLVR